MPALQQTLKSAPTLDGIPYSTGILCKLIEDELADNRTVSFPIDLACVEATKKYLQRHAFLQDRFGRDGYEVSAETRLSAPKLKSTEINKSYFIVVRRKNA